MDLKNYNLPGGGIPAKHDWTVIKERGGTGDEEGVAELIYFEKETNTKWYWQVRFKDENRLFKRAIVKPIDLQQPEPKKLLSVKRTAGDHNEVKYVYKKSRYKMYKANQKKNKNNY